MGKKNNKEVSVEMVKMSELPPERQEKTRILLMDKHIKRKIKPGEELKLEDIAREEGVSEHTKMSIGSPKFADRMFGDKPTLSSTTLKKAIINDFGSPCAGGRIFISKQFYFAYADVEIEKVISEDLTDLNMWVNTYFQSPDFSLVLAGVMKKKLKGVPFGILWVRYYERGSCHAINCYYSWSQKKMKVVEPQTDGIYDFNKEAYCPMLIIL